MLITVFSSEAIAQATNPPEKKRGLPLICGHRAGFYDEFPENSFAAINHTVRECNSSPVIVEIDIRASKDSTLYIMHDETVDRTTNGGGAISDLSDQYLNSLFLKNKDGSLTPERIPLFDSLLEFSRHEDLILMLDIKGNIHEKVMRRLVEKGLIHKCIVLTFNPSDTKMIYQLSPSVKISALIRNEGDWRLIKELSIPSGNLIAYIHASTTQQLISQLKNNLILVMTDVSESATKNIGPQTREYYQEFIRKRRLDIIITDFPVDVSRKIR